MYFKILREDLTHHGYIYQEGLNVYSKPYDSIPSNREGLFFTDIENISEFYSCGNKIAEVILPDGEEVIKRTTDYKAHKIILGEIRDLWTINTLEYLKECGVDFQANGHHILHCAARNDIWRLSNIC